MSTTINITKLLITGERRSGTTLVANLLNAQERITVYRDFLNIDRLKRRMAIASLVDSLSTTQRARLICELSHYDYDDAKFEFATAMQLQPTDFGTLLEFYLYVLRRIAKPGDVAAGHKTTMAHSIVGNLLELVPDLKVIYVVRDPRDVVSSALKRFTGETLFDFAESWLQSYAVMQGYLGNPEIAPRIMILRYEDLLLQKDQTLPRIAEFLGVDRIVIPETMTDYGEEWRGNSSFGELKETLDTTPIGRWRSQNPRAGRVAEILLFDAMIEAGYEMSEEKKGFERVQVETRYSFYRLVRKSLWLLRQVEFAVLRPLMKRLAAI